MYGTIDVVEDGGTPVLRLAGEIDRWVVAAFESARSPAVDAVDVGEVTFLDCGGLRFLLRQADLARAAGRPCVLRRPPRVVRRLLEATGTEQVFLSRPPDG